MYIDDCLQSVLQFMQCPESKLLQRTYNVSAMSFTPEEIVEEIKNHVPDLKVTYKIDSRQAIGKIFETRNLFHFSLILRNEF